MKINFHKLLCKLNYHNFKYWYDKKFAEFNMIQKMRKCTVCNKKERASYKREQEQENYNPEDEWHDYVPCNKCLKDKK